MVLLIYFALYATAIIIGTLVLAASLFLVEDRKFSSFTKYGVKSTFLRCAGIFIGTTVGPALVFAEDPVHARGWLSTLGTFNPLWGVVALVVWIGGMLVLFRKTPLQILILFPVNALFGLGIMGAIRFVLIRVLTQGEPQP